MRQSEFKTRNRVGKHLSKRIHLPLRLRAPALKNSLPLIQTLTFQEFVVVFRADG